MFLFLFSLFSQSASAAPCCAGSSAVPSLITGDETRLLSLSVSTSEVVGDAPRAGRGLPVFRDGESNEEDRRNLTVNFATLVSDRFQVGVSIPVVQNQVLSSSREETNTRFGDVSTTLGYEAIPEWEYSVWKPRVFTFLQWVAPTGRGMEESQSLFLSDVSGLGSHQLHLGAVAIKRWSDWDLNLVMKLGKEWSHASTLVNASLGGGYSFGEIWRAGLSLETQYQSPMKMGESSQPSFTSQKLVWNTGATVTALVGADSSLILSYVDQTLFGPAINTTLARSFSLAYQRRWER